MHQEARSDITGERHEQGQGCMRLAIMQPYVFPYLGYFQLLHAVDKFVAYDDVAFIKQGWINRNTILVNGRRHLFSVPVEDISSFRSIQRTMVSPQPATWTLKLLTTIRQSYSKAPYFRCVYPIVEATLGEAAGRSIGAVALQSVRSVLKYLSFATELVETSSIYGNERLKGADRVIDICRRERAAMYVNLSGGRDLYDREGFAAQGIELRFLAPGLSAYPQFTSVFTPRLSIIDVLMFNSPDRVRELCSEYELT
jgi:hypothetical protein